MSEPAADVSVFRARFTTRQQAERYRDRFASGSRARKDHLEREVLRKLLAVLGPLESALDLPSGAGRLSTVLAEFAPWVIQADASLPMLQIAREDHPHLRSYYVQADAAAIGLADRSVDLVFCHRMLHHIHDPATRARMFAELARVARRYVLLSFYPPGYRDRLRWLASALHGASNRRPRPATRQQFLGDAASVGLRLIQSPPRSRVRGADAFHLFEHARR
ncbi:MAG TPA: class I SAM-dependent methyltransferase [Phycisphaerae bacterium]